MVSRAIHRQGTFAALQNGAGPKADLTKKDIDKSIQIFLPPQTEAFPIM